MAAYHDDEWGERPATDRDYFERLVLEMFQAGLAWSTILNKRDGLRRAFAGFDPAAVASFGPDDVERLLSDASIIRNRGKVEAAIKAAGEFLDLVREHGSFGAFVEDTGSDGDALFAALRPRLRFFGPTIAESFFQSVGAVPAPHESGCWKAAG